MGFLVHDVAAAQPGKIDVVSFVLFVLNLKESFFSFLEFSGRCTGDTVVPVEIFIVDEVWADTLKVHKHIVELLEDEEARSHALASRDCVTLGG